jgi:RimJ/RimL family protein N-acetyltransferase
MISEKPLVRKDSAMEQFSKTLQLRDGTSILIRPLSKQDGPALLAFFTELPDDDRQFLREDFTRKEVIDRWIEELNFEKALPIVAEKDSAIVADATLHFNIHGWQRHMAEIRCVVSRKYQKKGLGTALMRELVHYAVERGVVRLCAYMMNTQQSAQRAFTKLGFKKEAELKNFVEDISGKTHNLVVMVNDVSELWKKMEDLLMDYDIKTMH